ncbi:hypothetical protein EDF56_11728 [Novosphingobium sp. PhB165]|uniref:hypothetical protein n=1 Tax=Novosphingobium sp. PhB165 TaxID=2485105 RepID=UPI00104980C1|nr:hypothetical protein [Novosphingobium sp. PhB165]TCM12864.1 hypothetical protein EDF56_11728 [Novosphingobium sp. PhB165]
MGAQKISLDQARDILEKLEEALTSLEICGQPIIAAHVQMAVDLLCASTDIDENSGAQIDP